MGTIATNDVPEFSEVKNNELFQYNDEVLINTDCYLMPLFPVNLSGQDEAVVIYVLLTYKDIALVVNDGLFFVII